MVNLKAIKAERKKIGSQETMARLLGISLASYHNKESGKNAFTVGEVEKFCEVCHINDPSRICEIFLGFTERKQIDRTDIGITMTAEQIFQALDCCAFKCDCDHCPLDSEYVVDEYTENCIESLINEAKSLIEKNMRKGNK